MHGAHLQILYLMKYVPDNVQHYLPHSVLSSMFKFWR